VHIHYTWERTVGIALCDNTWERTVSIALCDYTWERTVCIVCVIIRGSVQ